MKTVKYNYNNQKINFFLKSDNLETFMRELKFTPSLMLPKGITKYKKTDW